MPMARISKSFTKQLLKFRESMSVSDVARNYDISWRCVKDAEKGCLAAKYKTVSPKGVEAVTIDEMHLFPHEKSNRKYVTIARDAETGRVPSVTRISAEPQASFA